MKWKKLCEIKIKKNIIILNEIKIKYNNKLK